MKIIYGQNLTPEQTASANIIAKECDILFDTARLLLYRGIDTVNKAKRFLSAGKNGFIDPFLLSGMHEAVDRITLAKERDESILIFGDYDADGVSATTVLYNCLKDFGIKNLSRYVPEREEGYGINLETIKRLTEKNAISLIITVDCGISDYEKIDQLKETGIEVIVTDHHEPPEILPNCIKINPKIPNQQYAFNGLCGAGVAYKLGNALIGDKANKYLDFVALATVADSMDLIDENRDIVVEGLKLFNDKSTLKLPFKYILGENDKQVTAQTLAYTIAPRINAGGRMDDANCALELFTETDPQKVFDLAVKLGQYNIERQNECDKMFHEAVEKIQKMGLQKRNVILIKEERWRAGFIGIVAAKLVEVFRKPTVVFAGQGDHLKGSARSVEGLNIHDAISSVKDLLIGYGGHSQAAGLSVEKDKFIALDRALNDLLNKEYGKIDTQANIYAEWDIKEEIPMRFVKEIDLLEPFGVGNRRPVFTMELNAVDSLPLRAGSPHYTFKAHNMDMIDFNGQKNVMPLSYPINKKVAFEINLSTFKSREYVKGFVKAVCPEYNDFDAMSAYVLENELKKALDKGNSNPIISVKNFISNGTGTIYTVSDYKKIKDYPEIKSLPVYLFEPEGKGVADCVVVSLRAVPDGFERVVYLDKPLADCGFSSVKNFLSLNAKVNEKIKNLSVDRNDFARIFSVLKTIKNYQYKGSANLSSRYFNGEDAYFAVFVIEVFFELGIFSVDKGILVHNENVKNALTNSTLYSKIYLLKDKDV